MASSKYALRVLGLAAVLIPSIVGIVSAYRQNALILSGTFHIASGPATTAVVCKRTLRVVNVDKSDVLNLREEPHTQAPIRFGIPAEARGLVDLGEKKGAWRRIAFRGEVGFVHGAFVAEDAEICVPKPDAGTDGRRRAKPQDAANAKPPVM